MKYPKEYLDEIKLRLKVSLVVGKIVRLKKRGKEYIGLSPFKNEKSPSFTVNDEKEFYHCFSSGEHGNIFDFLMKTKSIGFGEAVRSLAAEAGMISGSMSQAIMAGATSGKLGMAVAFAATNLAIMGIQQTMAPDPATDSDAPDNYSFNGNAQNIKQGDPVPLLYGELRVPGRPISININNTTPTFVGNYEDANGEINPVDTDGGGDTSENEQTMLH